MHRRKHVGSSGSGNVSPLDQRDSTGKYSKGKMSVRNGILLVLLPILFLGSLAWWMETNRSPGRYRPVLTRSHHHSVRGPRGEGSVGGRGTEKFHKNKDDRRHHHHPHIDPQLIEQYRQEGRLKHHGAAADDFVEKEEEEDLSTDEYHIIFSTSCSSFQDYQSYLLFYQAIKIKQRGNITRIISGCTPEEEEEHRRQEKQIMEHMSDRFRFHFTPEFGLEGDTGKGWQKHKYFNKPFGVRHWLENYMGYPDSPKHKDTIVVLVDPDMLFLRPFNNDFRDFYPGLWFKDPEEPLLQVSHGFPVAQRYGFGSRWKTGIENNLTYVVGEDSPVHGISNSDASLYYPAGPPYILTVQDMYTIGSKWTEFATKSYEVKQQFMAEMYGYSLGAAHTRLPHQLASGFMVSDLTTNKEEGWAYIDSLELEDACKEHPPEKLPMVLHYCHRYAIGEYFFSKYKLNDDIVGSCEAPLLKEPPQDVAVQFDYSHYGDGTVKRWGDDKKMRVRNAFMICNLLPAMNGAAIFFKQNNCGDDANYDKTFTFFDESGAVIA